MSFFGFDSRLPRDRGHQTSAPGFGATQDAFDGLQSARAADNDEILNFDDTYEGLGGRLDDAADDLNDDTFGDEGPVTQKNVGRDFDFSGQTGNVAQAFEEERMRWAAQHAPSRVSPVKKAAAPRHGYRPIQELEVDADLWGIAKKEPEPAAQPPPAAARKAMTLEEVEAMMQAQSKPKAPQQAAQQQYGEPSMQQGSYPIPTNPQEYQQQPFMQHQGQHHQHQGHHQQHQSQHQQQQQWPAHPQILQRPPGQPQQQQQQQQQPPQPSQPTGQNRPPQILQRQRQPESSPQQQQQIPTGPKHHGRQQQQQQSAHQQAPRQILQNPNRLSGPGQPISHQQFQPGHGRGPSGPIISHPSQILQLSDEDRAAYLQEEARRAKRNHKIHLLSKHNGLMTPQDKNFITRIQLQQLVTATGSVDSEGPEGLLSEDFYYQVYSQIRGAPRQNPHQPANQFAQTYLFQTGGRYGQNRRHPRGGENHMQRMEQQVQRAVEAAKAKPKNKQLVIEGSLGKISFSNAKTPKPLLNIKRLDSDQSVHVRRPSRHHDPTEERRSALKNIEKVYGALMETEDHARLRPLEESEMFDLWAAKTQQLNDKLWASLKAYEPIVENHATLHPFIAILSHAKGKKAIPRVFRHLSNEQRTVVLTVILVHLDTLDVVHNALSSPIPAKVKEDIELFVNAVIPPLFSHLNDSPLVITSGLLGLIVSRCDIKAVTRTKIGLQLLTMLVARAELLREAAVNGTGEPGSGPNEFAQYTSVYNDFFNALEPLLMQIWPRDASGREASPLASEDVYVWQFLAAMGATASAEQQQRLVLGVKDRVMSSVGAARTLPAGEQERRLGEVNLFMRALGLDVELLA
ncbi:hypothetical protein BT63DRAFT_431836 [Microthyrium microscopicum]|uniref:mRNA decay factor PAT1 domain-containing protein n=1 Tax=Microthyrium microscopicum TaxID=703497 RepID=A0A6A6UJI1_9PEZI|nr:hypothetical protein BT63DRAFT_431836 [Microthyrium microscopicum]